MVIGIDASHLIGGGGITHLVEFLRAADPEKQCVSLVVIWGRAETLARLPDQRWLKKVNPDALNRGLLWRLLWQRFRLSREAQSAGCDVLFIPGGSYVGSFRPIVAMSQNLLPFDWLELRRYGVSKRALRLLLLRYIQGWSFRRADGVIFLTEYARKAVIEVTGQIAGKVAIIPHGVDSRFEAAPRKQLDISNYSLERPFKILYVSSINLYKHQCRIAEAVADLRKAGLPVILNLVGPGYPPSLRSLKHTMSKVDPQGEFIKYLGMVPYAEVHIKYQQAELAVFASSCENMPNILIESMASGLPIVCSNRGPMPEVLGKAGVYFDPERHDEILLAMRTLINSPGLREEKAHAAYGRAQQFTWERCASETIRFLSGIANHSC